jgi:hypothetical protein
MRADALPTENLAGPASRSTEFSLDIPYAYPEAAKRNHFPTRYVLESALFGLRF